MCVCVFVCMCVCVYVCVDVYVYADIYIYVCVYTYIYTERLSHNRGGRAGVRVVLPTSIVRLLKALSCLT